MFRGMAMPPAKGDAKAKRYDRQIRIWGAHGQDALERAHICLVNAGAPFSHSTSLAVHGSSDDFSQLGSRVSRLIPSNDSMLESRPEPGEHTQHAACSCGKPDYVGSAWLSMSSLFSGTCTRNEVSC